MGWLDNMVLPESRGIRGKLLPRCVTIAEVLHDAGYFTAMAGKWHLGQQNGTPPWKRGFQRSLNSPYGEIYFPKETGGPGTRNLYLNGKELPKDSPVFGKNWYSTDLFTEWGLKFIDEARARKSRSSCTSRKGRSIFRCGRRARSSRNTTVDTWQAGTSCGNSGMQNRLSLESSIRAGR